ncbi:MAG TPA: hypothetical protein VGR35_14180 [Tepidisphaeraceae bacterium]|nr:hypothetical protein [Tepidisphaeraceae bacterium]
MVRPVLSSPAFSSSALALAALAAPPAQGAQFASSVSAYAMGNVFTASGATYSDTSRATGAPHPIVDEGQFYQASLNPYNPHWETTQLTAIGRGGSITLQYAQPMVVGAGHEIGVFTSASLGDADFDGVVDSPVKTFAGDEYGAERTAVVEVAGPDGNFVSLGRVIFDKPTNYYSNVPGPYVDPATFSGIVADFDKPFTADLSVFEGKNFSQVIAALEGSAGGTWIDVPTDAGLTQISFVRFSDTMWRTADGSLVETRSSRFDASYVKPADLFIDAVAVVPEPGAAGAGVVLAAGALLRRRRGCRGLYSGQVHPRGWSSRGTPRDIVLKVLH